MKFVFFSREMRVRSEKLEGKHFRMTIVVVQITVRTKFGLNENSRDLTATSNEMFIQNLTLSSPVFRFVFKCIGDRVYLQSMNTPFKFIKSHQSYVGIERC